MRRVRVPELSGGRACAVLASVGRHVRQVRSTAMPSIYFVLPDPIFVLAGVGLYAEVVRSSLSGRSGAMSSPNVAPSYGGICRPNASRFGRVTPERIRQDSCSWN